MTDEFVQTLVMQAPNFIGFMLLTYLMWKVISQQNEMIKALVLDCLNDDNDKSQEPTV